MFALLAILDLPMPSNAELGSALLCIFVLVSIGREIKAFFNDGRANRIPPIVQEPAHQVEARVKFITENRVMLAQIHDELRGLNVNVQDAVQVIRQCDHLYEGITNIRLTQEVIRRELQEHFAKLREQEQ